MLCDRLAIPPSIRDSRLKSLFFNDILRAPGRTRTYDRPLRRRPEPNTVLKPRKLGVFGGPPERFTDNYCVAARAARGPRDQAGVRHIGCQPQTDITTPPKGPRCGSSWKSRSLTRARIDLADLRQPGYRARPLADHIADQVAATFETYGEHARPSTRRKIWWTSSSWRCLLMCRPPRCERPWTSKLRGVAFNCLCSYRTRPDLLGTALCPRRTSDARGVGARTLRDALALMT